MRIAVMMIGVIVLLQACSNQTDKLQPTATAEPERAVETAQEG